jgi:protein gp37
VADQSTIEWTDTTWNPVAGCKIASAGCSNCYAMRLAARLDAMGVEKYRGLTRKSGTRRVWSGKIRCDEASLGLPSRWQRPRKIFVNSMSDLFHEDVPLEFISRVWATMGATPRHTYQILTKRPERMRLVTGTRSPIPYGSQFIPGGLWALAELANDIANRTAKSDLLCFEAVGLMGPSPPEQVTVTRRSRE